MKKSTFLQGLLIGLIPVAAIQFVRAQNGMGIEVTNPLEMLDVNGAIRIGTDHNNTTGAPQGGAGTIRWNGIDFEGWDGTQWVVFGGGTGTAGWELAGNAGTVPGTDFIGTTDNQELVFKVANTEAGRIGTNTNRNTTLGMSGGIGTGERNSGVGWHVFSSNMDGTGNSALGYNVMVNSTGNYNAAMGWQAMTYTTSGNRNVALGSQAMRDNTTGSDNVAIGYNAGIGNSIGNRNVFIGRVAGENATGSYNVFIGNGAGRDETGSNKLYVENTNATDPLLYGEFDNDILGVNGNLGVGTQAPQEELHIEGSIRMVDGNEQAGYIPVSDANGTMTWTDPTTVTTADDDDWSVNGNDIYNANTGNVGIGTSIPSAPLEINNNYANIKLTDANDNVGFSIIAPNPSSSITGGVGTITNHGFPLFTNNVDRMTITSNGKIGIGTNAPNYEVGIKGDNDNAWLQFTTGSTGSNALDGFLIGVHETNDAVHLIQREASDMIFRTDNTERMRIDADGNVGIGTVTPGSALHVVPTTANGPTATFETGSNPYPTSLKILPATHATSERASIQIDDWDILQDRTGTGTKDFAIYQTSTSSQRFNIDVSGNIGVGDETPDARLDVAGQIQMETGAVAGYIPVSDANGTMTWTDPTTIATADSVLQDGDADTKIQVEESFDEDIIRFDIAGTEQWLMASARLEPNNSGSSVFIGDDAGLNDDLSNNKNIAIGRRASEAGVTAKQNVVIGDLALLNNTGDNNVAIGETVMQHHTSGDGNTVIGKSGLFNNTTGENNTVVGLYAGYSNISGDANVFLGHRAGQNETGSNKLYIENTNSASPLIYGEFDNDIVGINGALAVGHQTPMANLDVAGDGSTSTSLLLRNGNGGGVFNSNQMTLGYNGGVTFKHAVKTRHNSGQDATNAIDFYLWDHGTDANADVGTKHVMTIDGNGDGMVGINTTSPAEELHVIGSICMVDGNQTTGYIPVSDANGTMVWTDPTTIATASDGDGDATNELQSLSISGTDVTLSNGGGTISLPAMDELSDADGDTKLQVEESTNEDKIRFDTGGSQRMIIDNAGNVGIGTGTPVSQLQVQVNQNALNIPVLLKNVNHTENGGNAVGLGFVNASHDNPKAAIVHERTNNWGRGNLHVLVNDDTNNSAVDMTDVAATFTRTKRLGIATSTPSYDLSFSGDGNRTIGMEEASVDDGYDLTIEAGSAKSGTANGDGGTLILSAGAATGNGGISPRSEIVFKTATQLGSSSSATQNPTEKMRIDANGNVGIGTSNPGHALQVGTSGDGTEARANAWNTFSDRRWKKNFEVIPNALGKLQQVNGYFYNWKEGVDSTQQVGIIAQEIEEILPQAVSTDENGYKSVDYSKLTAWLIQVNKEQEAKMFLQEQQIEDLKVQLTAEKADNAQRLQRIEELLQIELTVERIR